MLFRYILPTAILAVLIGAVAYFSYLVARDYFKPKEYEQLFEEYFSKQPMAFDPAKIDQRITYLRDSKGYVGGYDPQIMLFEQLTKQAWYYPDKTVESMLEALPLGLEMYRSEPYWREYLGPQVAFAYLYAGLPSAAEAWCPEAAAQAPQDYYRIKLIQMSSRVSQDDIAGAREVAKAELRDQLSVAGRVFQIAAGILLEEDEALDDFHVAPAQASALPYTLRWYYAAYLFEKGDFRDAADQFQYCLDDAPQDPVMSLELAAALLGDGIVDQAKVDALLRVAAASTRSPMSVEGARAVCLSSLIQVNPQPDWWDELEGLGMNFPGDFVIASSLADASLELSRNPNGDVSQKDFESAPEYLVYAQQALDLANGCWQLQSAHLNLAIAYAQWWLDSGNDTCLGKSIDHLLNSLGSSSGSSPVEPTRIPEYEYFLLDECVSTARKSEPAFDSKVNTAVMEFLERVRAQYPAEFEIPDIRSTR